MMSKLVNIYTKVVPSPQFAQHGYNIMAVTALRLLPLTFTPAMALMHYVALVVLQGPTKLCTH